MDNQIFDIPANLGKKYINHSVFGQIEEYCKFYNSLSFSVMNWISQGTRAIINIDTRTFSSIEGTLNSILFTLKTGRINDSYALLRKLFDATIINIYTNLFLIDNFSVENLIVQQIEKWRTGEESIPEYRVISQYIRNSSKLSSIASLIHKDNRYKEIRKRCNNHTHYNFYHNLLLNDNEIYLPERVKYLDQFLEDITDVFIQHFVLIFYLNDHFMMSSDYIDHLDLGLTPPKDSQYWVASFIENIFYNVINEKRPDLALELMKKTNMQLSCE